MLVKQGRSVSKNWHLCAMLLCTIISSALSTCVIEKEGSMVRTNLTALLSSLLQETATQGWPPCYCREVLCGTSLTHHLTQRCTMLRALDGWIAFNFWLELEQISTLKIPGRLPQSTSLWWRIDGPVWSSFLSREQSRLTALMRTADLYYNSWWFMLMSELKVSLKRFWA